MSVEQGKKPPSAGSQAPDEPGTASDHNNSMITTVSADRDTEKSSPVTSPFIQRKPLKSNDSMFHLSDPNSRFNDVVLEKSKELNCLMREIVQTVELKDEGLSNFIKDNELNIIAKRKLDWKTLVELSESIFNDYSKEMESITKEFDELNKELLIWQESTYITDSEKVAKRLGTQEEWINSKESYLNYTRNELIKSAELIDNAIKNLKPDPSTSCISSISVRPDLNE